MRRNSLIAAALCAFVVLGAGRAAFAGGLVVPGTPTFSWFNGPQWWITGNDIGGIIAYSPEIEGVYRQWAAAHCARWDRLSHITSVHRIYGDYISFVCMDRPGVIH